MLETTPLLLGALLVGILHMSAPDHWVTLILLGRVAGWSRGRLWAMSLVTALGHVILSVAIGFAILGVGLIFSKALESEITQATGVIMIVGGLAYGVKELATSKEEDYQREAEDEFRKVGKGSALGIGYFAVLGAALSPDLSVLPIFVLAVPAGVGLAAEAALVFGVGSVVTLFALVALGSRGLERFFEKVPPKYNDSLVGFVIAIIGAYILISG